MLDTMRSKKFAQADEGQPVMPMTPAVTDAPAVPIGQVTGGNYPSVRTPATGGQVTGGNYPSTPTSGPGQITGGNYPSVPTAPPSTPPVTRPTDPTQPVVTNPTQGGFAPAQVVSDTLNQIVDPNSAYMRNARARGLEQAAARGNRAGSSIAAGASQRAALEAAQPLLSAAMSLHGQREQNAFTGEQNQLERNRDYTQAQLQDWVNSQSFSRDFYGALTMMPINSAYQLNSLIQTYALENPEVYTADVISGMSNFFTQNFSQVLGTFFPSLFGGGRTGGGP